MKARVSLETLLGDGDVEGLEASFGPLVDRILLTEGIDEIDRQSRITILTEFARAATQGMAVQVRKAIESDYSPDAKADRFPRWQVTGDLPAAVSLTGLVEAWWAEAQRTGRSVSTREAYARAFRYLAEFLQHADASKVTQADIIAFKDYRLRQINDRTGKPISAQTVKDSDLPALKSVFQWAVDNGRLRANPAQNIKVSRLKKKKLRQTEFMDEEVFPVSTNETISLYGTFAM